MSLMEFYKSVSNPLDDPNTMKRIFEAYSNGYSFYNELSKIIPKDMAGKYNPVTYNALFAGIFNTWKNNVLSVSYDEFLRCKKQGLMDDDFIVLRKFLKGIPDVTSAREAQKIMNNGNYSDALWRALDKYNYAIFDPSWTHFKSRYLNLRRESSFPVEHRLYVNLELPDLYEFSIYFINKCDKHKVPYYFKFDGWGARSDTLVIYSSTELLTEYVQIINEIKKEHPDMMSRVKEPPVLTGKLDGFIGYGSEPKESGRESFNGKRCRSIEKIIDKNVKEWLFSHINDSVRYGGRVMSFKDYLATLATESLLEGRRKIYEGEVRRAKKNNRPEILSDLGYTLEDLNSAGFKRHIYSYIRQNIDGLLEGYRKKDRYSFEIPLRGDKKRTYYVNDMEKIIKRLASKIAAVDSSFVSKVKEEIVQDSIKFGADPNNYAFDTIRVQRMQDAYKSSSRQKVNLESYKREFDLLMMDLSASDLDRYEYDDKITRAMEIAEFFRKVDRKYADLLERRIDKVQVSRRESLSGDVSLDSVNAELVKTSRRINELQNEIKALQEELHGLDTRGKRR